MSSTKKCVRLMCRSNRNLRLGGLCPSTKARTNKWKRVIRAARHSLDWVVCLGAIIVASSNAQAQNLFASVGSNIYEFTPSGTQNTFASGLLSSSFGLAFDSAGNLFAADSTGIYKFTPEGVRSTFASGPGFTAVAFDSAGNLFATDGSNIDRFTQSGVLSNFASGLTFPSFGLAFDSGGNLFAADRDNIYKFTPDGVQSTFASGFRPSGLAFDSAGDLFAGGSGGIGEFTPSGAESGFASTVPYSPTALAFQVPEPSTWSLLALGAVALLGSRRLRRRSA